MLDVISYKGLFLIFFILRVHLSLQTFKFSDFLVTHFCVHVMVLIKLYFTGDDQLAKRRKKNSRSSSSEDMKFPSPTSQMKMTPQMAPTGTPPVTYCPPHKMDLYSPPGSSSDGEINSTNYMSDSTENSSVNSPPKGPYLSFSPSLVKKEHNEDDYPRPLSDELAKEIQLMEKEYRLVFDSGYSEDQARKLVDKPHSANDLFNMTDIFIRRLIKFAKHIVEFKSLKQEDQIYLLKVRFSTSVSKKYVKVSKEL